MWISRRRNKSPKREAGRRKRSHLGPEEKEETEEIIYIRETKEEKEGRKE
jgi:hypothetical protein